jgi:hypothetical protein
VIRRENHVQDYKFHVFPFASDYTLELIIFTIENLEIFVTNSEVHAANTRHRHYLHRPVANLSAFQSIRKEFIMLG